MGPEHGLRIKLCCSIVSQTGMRLSHCFPLLLKVYYTLPVALHKAAPASLGTPQPAVAIIVLPVVASLCLRAFVVNPPWFHPIHYSLPH